MSPKLTPEPETTPSSLLKESLIRNGFMPRFDAMNPAPSVDLIGFLVIILSVNILPFLGTSPEPGLTSESVFGSSFFFGFGFGFEPPIPVSIGLPCSSTLTLGFLSV